MNRATNRNQISQVLTLCFLHQLLICFYRARAICDLQLGILPATKKILRTSSLLQECLMPVTEGGTSLRILLADLHETRGVQSLHYLSNSFAVKTLPSMFLFFFWGFLSKYTDSGLFVLGSKQLTPWKMQK